MIKINPEVKKALEEGRAVVALESTIISHGMPYPKNVQTALEVERVIREHGAVPATIGIIDGDAIVGSDGCGTSASVRIHAERGLALATEAKL